MFGSTTNRRTATRTTYRFSCNLSGSGADHKLTRDQLGGGEGVLIQGGEGEARVILTGWASTLRSSGMCEAFSLKLLAAPKLSTANQNVPNPCAAQLFVEAQLAELPVRLHSVRYTH